MGKEASKSATSVHNINYHLIWCVKYRRKLLVGPVETRLKEILADTAAANGVEIKSMEVMPDHVHLFIHAAPVWSAHSLVQRFKGISSRLLRSQFPHLRSKLPTLWTRSYYAETVGHISEAVIRKYIEEQKKV